MVSEYRRLGDAVRIYKIENRLAIFLFIERHITPISRQGDKIGIRVSITYFNNAIVSSFLSLLLS